VLVYSIRQSKFSIKRLKYELTLLPLDSFLDDTGVHFSSSRILERFGVITVGVVSTDTGGDDLLIFSDSDVRNLKDG